MTGEAVRIKVDIKVKPEEFGDFYRELGLFQQRWAWGGGSTMVSIVPVDEKGRRTTCAWPRYLQD